MYYECAHCAISLIIKMGFERGGGGQFMQILGLLGMYFDAVVVFVMKFSTSFKLAIPR